MQGQSIRWVLGCALLCGCSSDDGPGPETGGGSGASVGSGAAGASGAAAGGAGRAGSSGSGGSGRAGAAGSAGIGGVGGGVGGSSAGAGGTTAGSGGSSAASGGSAGVAGGGGATAGTGGAPVAPLGCETPDLGIEFEHVFDVGPDQDYATPAEVPWEALEPSTLVRIHARPEPYRDKWVLNATGTADAPIVVLGVPERGVLPVISGEDAITRSELDYWNEPRGIVKVGGANVGDGAAYVTIACLDIQTARPGTSFTDASGASVEYADNAACVYLEEGEHVTVRDNLIHGCGNGIFASSGSSDVLVSGNFVYDNGNEGSIYEHNSYTEATNITFEFNHYGPLCAGCEGNNLKDRSAGTIIRYNWLESGNRQLDLVESDHDELIENPAYRRTFVYGNVLVEPDGAGNSQIVHYGGDGGDESTYRKGTLYFLYNTVVSTRAGNTTLFRASSEDERIDAWNNVVWTTAGGDRLAISAGMGVIDLEGNWLPAGWVPSHDTLTGAISETANVEGSDPGFADAENQDFSIASDSPCRGAAIPLPADVTADLPLFEYEPHQSGAPRPSVLDIGAYESDG